MEILNHAIKVEGNASKLARALGIEPNVVNNWKHRNKLPPPWQIALQLKYGRRKPSGAHAPQAETTEASATTTG